MSYEIKPLEWHKTYETTERCWWTDSVLGRIFIHKTLGGLIYWNHNGRMGGGADTETIDQCKIAAEDYYRSRLSSALVQVQEAGDSWRPIESAPKDRRSILVWCDGNRCAYTAVWLECGRESHWYSFGGIGRLKDEPTHWRPLPSPPELSLPLREKGEAGNG